MGKTMGLFRDCGSKIFTCFVCDDEFRNRFISLKLLFILYVFIVFHVRLFNLISSFFSLFLEIFDDTVNFIHRMRSVQITIMYALRLLLNIYENISHIFQ